MKENDTVVCIGEKARGEANAWKKGRISKIKKVDNYDDSLNAIYEILEGRIFKSNLRLATQKEIDLYNSGINQIQEIKEDYLLY